MKHLSNLLLIGLLFVSLSLTGDVHGRVEGKTFHFLGKGMEIGKSDDLQAKGRRPQKISRIQLAVGRFDPLLESEPFTLPQGMKIQALPTGETGYYIIQFRGPVQQTWKDDVMEAGAKIFDYIPDFAFIVKMDEKTKVRVEAMDSVRWVGIYQPGYRVEPYLMQSHVMAEKAEALTLIVVTFRGEDVSSIADVLRTMGGTVLDVSETEWKGKIKVRIDSTKVAEIAQIQGVKWIEKAPVWKLFNDVGRGIMNVDTVWTSDNLFGEGQVVAVADTGLDQGSTDPAHLHDDFEDFAGGSRVDQIFDLVGDGADDVNSGHGTHVAGSVLGNGEESKGIHAGVAPEARLIFQALEDNGNPGALDGIPGDLNTLFDQARTAAPTGAHIHTNSWGASVAGAYTSSSEEVDENTWDNKEFTILFSAGNDGIDANADGVIDLYSMGSPATAKNCITVGASENDRPSGSTPAPGYDIPWATGSWADYYPVGPIASDHVSNNSEGMAAFSSRGPCLDGRTKPDIVAPGTNIISTLSSQVTLPVLWGSGGLAGGPLEDYYVFSGGTSMSTPLAAGAAALVREFYTDQIVPLTPSSALIKATLINGAADMSGQYAGAEVIDGPRPNQAEGWGRIDLESSISPALPKMLQYYDETTGLTTGATHIYNISVGAGDVPLKVTLVWTDYPGSPVAGGGLVNDLDLTVTDPNVIVHFPNNASQRGTTQIMSYDDGSWEDGVNWEDAGSGWAVRFTPSSYPVTVDTARFYLILFSLPGSQITCNIWDDNGPGGLPGTNLFSQTVSPAVKGFNGFWYEGWYTVSISGVTINEGSFYVEMRYATTDPFNPFLAIDETTPAGRSYYYNGSSWSALPLGDINGNWFIQATAMTPALATSADRVNNVVGIDIDAPVVTGLYSVRIEGHNIPQGPQPYALVITGGDISPLSPVSPPQAPTDLLGQVISLTQVDLTWTDNSGDETGFRIERKEGAAGTYQQIDIVGVDVENYTDTTTGGVTYYYRVRAYNASGDSAPSNEAGVKTGIPDDPSDLSATAVSYRRIDLSWIDNSLGETGFKIERRTGAGAWGLLAMVGPETESYADASCAASTTYYYQVFSYNPLGDSAASDEASATTPAAPAVIPPIGGGGGGGGGGCFIATAAYGSRLAKEVKVLGRVRDKYLLTNVLGRAFVSAYYRYSPDLADCMVKHPMMKSIVRIGLYPILELSKWFVGGDPSR